MRITGPHRTTGRGPFRVRRPRGKDSLLFTYGPLEAQTSVSSRVMQVLMGIPNRRPAVLPALEIAARHRHIRCHALRYGFTESARGFDRLIIGHGVTLDRGGVSICPRSHLPSSPLTKHGRLSSTSWTTATDAAGCSGFSLSDSRMEFTG